MASERRGGRDVAAEHVRQAPDSNWHTKTELAAWETVNVEQAPASLVAEQRQAVGTLAELALLLRVDARSPPPWAEEFEC